MTIIYKSLAARLRFLSSVCGLALLTVLSTTGVVAQVGPPNGTSTVAGTALAGTTAYAFAQSSGTYTAITGGTVYQSAGTLNTDAVSSAVNIGFNFLYNNRTYSTVRISNNGFITFGANAPLTTTYTGLSSNVNPAYEGAIAGFAANLRASAVAGATPEIRYETLGASPNRTFVVQFQDVGVSTTATTQRLNFQIRISETTNVVQIVYGTTAWATATATGQVGLKGGESSDLSNRTGTTWTALTGGTGATSSCTLGTTGGTTVPASGLTFTWTPGSTWSAASYATLPFLQDFTTWTNALNTADVAGTNMRTWPSRGDVTWRASTNLVSGFTSTVGWGGTGGQTATYSGAAVAPGARFHSFDCSAGSYGDMDFYLDMSSSPIGLYNVQFLHNNPSGTDVIQVFYSGDGGATFTQVGSNIGTAGNAWNTFSNNMAGTATSVIRIRAIGDFGNDDINIDNFRVVSLTCASPSALLYTPSSATGGTLSWTNPSAGTPTNYEYEIRTSGAAGSGAAGLVTSGTVAHPTNSAAISAGTLSANTAYSVYIRTDCGGGDLSGWSSATAFTTPCTPSVAPFSQTFATAYSLAPTGNPTCWREATGVINLSGNSTVTTGTNSWGSSNFANVAGNTGFKINLYGTNNAWVITEPITLGVGNWALAYSMAVTGYNNTASVADLGTHAVRVIVSTDFGTTWSSANIIKTYTGAAAYSTAGATEYVSLNAYAGQTVQIAFVASTTAFSPDIDFHLDNIAVIVPCSGTPVIGTAAAASPTSLDCAGSVVSLTMDAGAQVGGGVSYQWQSSTDGVSFSNISGATGSTYNTPSAVVSSTYYRGSATCSFSGLTNTTADYFVEAGFPTPSVSAFPPQYCGTGGTSALTATITGANPYDTFVWAVGSGETGVLSNETNTTADWTITQSAGFTYTVTDTTTGCQRVVSQSVNVLGGVNPNMQSTPAVVCSTDAIASLSSGLSAANFSSTTIAHDPISVVSGILTQGGTAVVPLTSGTLDDGGWGNVPLGFTFNFFGTNYTTCNVGTNGNIMFGTYNGTALADFTFLTLPSATEPNPMIAGLAHDMHLTLSGTASGTVRYRTAGFPGNRRFILSYEGVRQYAQTNTSTFQIHIYEATGIVEVHVTSSTATSNKVVGVNGPGGTIGVLALGTTAAISTPIAYRFTPPQNYSTTWTVTAGTATISPTPTATNGFNASVINMDTPGTVSFNLQLTNQQTGCVTNAPLNVEVVAPPSTPVSASIEAYGSSLGSASATTTPLTVCGDQDVKVVYVGSLGVTDQVKWYNASTGGTLLANNDTLDIAGLSADDTVWVAINNGACTESGRFQYVINYNAAPAVTVNSLGPDSDVNCGEGPTYGMSYSMTSGASPAYTYTWTNDGNAVSFLDNGGGSATLTSTETTTSSWTAFQAGTGCTISGSKSFGVYPFPAIVPTAADTAICIGDSTVISSNLSVTNFSVKCVPFAFRTAPGTAVDLCLDGIRNNSYGGSASLDDGGWEGIPLGFTFNYFGLDFTNVNVGTNGVINFGPYANFNVSQYSFPSGFPSASSPVNTIGVLATDFYLTNIGYVRFWTEGAAPNRVFVLEYNGPGWTADGTHNAQVHLYETLGLVEIHVNEATGTGTFAGPKTIGLQNGDGTVGATAPLNCDVNGNQVGLATWNSRTSIINTIDPKAWRFSPPVSYTFAWTPSGEISGSTTNSSVLARPTATTAGTQSYFVTVTDNNSGCVGTPVELEFDLLDPVAAPDVVGFGVLSDLDGTNTIAFCAEQDLNLYVAAGAGYDSTYNAVWYTEAVGGLGFAIAYYDTVAYGIAGPAGIAADDSLWVSIDNGICEGPRRLVVLDYQEPDSLVITNSSPINCGPSTLTYVSNLSVSSAGDYTYTWSPSSALDVTTGTAVVATVNNTVNVTVTAVDATGFCTVQETSPVSRFDFPVVVPTALNDSICPGGQTQLSSNTSSSAFLIQPTGYSPNPGENITTILSNGVASQALAVGSLDDGVWTGIPIGFTFNFLGNDYTQVGIGTNGNVQFGPTFSTSFIPTFGPAAPNNFIALFWTDLNMGPGNGTNSVRYWTTGSAPNRIFSVSIDGARFGSAGANRMTGQIDLYETTGIVIAHIQEADGNGFSNTIVGCEDLTGTIGSAAPGRSDASWSVTTPEGWRFIPPVDYSFSWLPTAGINGQTDLSEVVAQPTATTQYQLIVTDNNTGCVNDLNNQAYVTVTIASAPPVAAFNANDITPSTGGVLQVVTFNNTTPSLGSDTYVWTFSPNTVQYAGGTNANSQNPQVQFLEPGSYTVTLNVTSCTGTDDLVRNNYIDVYPEYCFPEFGSGSGFDGCDDGDAVGNVVITNPSGVNIMQHLNTGCTTEPGAYEEFAPVAGVTTATVYQGTTYSMQVTSVNPAYTEFFAAFLDVDDDGDFNDPLEFLGGNASAATSATFDIGIPTSNVTYGPHRLRVIAAFGTGPLDANDACIVTAYGEAHDYIINIQPPVVLNDIPAFASNVAYSTNLNYPTCYPITGNTSLASNSPESATTGNDIWYRFTAQSTGVSITLTSSAFDDAIGLYSRDAAGNYNLVASENIGSGAGDFERLNVGGLTAGTQYWVSVGSAAAGAGGAFSLCIQNLMPSSCAYAIPAAGFRLCDAFKAIYRGAPSQGVTYNFNFTPVAPTPGSTTSVNGTNGLMVLSNAAAALRYGGVYNADVDVLYTLNNSAGSAEPILVDGNSSSVNCTNVTIQAHPLMEVRSTQRCPATLLRSNFLVGSTVAGSTSTAVCGAINYTYEFTQVTSCADGTVISVVPATFNTAAATPYLGLGVLGNLPNAGAWDVRIRPNFSYGPGNFGPVQRILVNNTSASSMLNDDAAEMDVKVDSFIAANLYPNPNNGDMVNLNVSGIESDNVFVRITDAMGRVVYTNRFSVEGSLNTIVTFSEPLASGIYNVEFTVDGQIMTERMIVAKQ